MCVYPVHKQPPLISHPRPNRCSSGHISAPHNLAQSVFRNPRDLRENMTQELVVSGMHDKMFPVSVFIVSQPPLMN